uniref:Sulfotransferase n=1 Tax=Tetraselmis chuii TaxID=63592 RepID=A0A6U1K0N7_9CHLO|mmetsp:Transcript_4090/g.7503  ORF Transcript_4090/g.7503 Transcript_4090/m.7503 type:complete len:247 (+) Transcript_4090:114-854(+)|eukprot:CAMPEP_0177768748 /NCGR_PEP_ID=MMETSP0491_2-20121128/9904_1 /TAXON_ID=63592 /ORGANISM="Tetraselmis chuii, Strain PLY429" /LENGTH=246 /DNA_ID=CAMNT_0019285611 /DNA_START=65 /DNA_END=805 /DNA_ORIENTATION=+
MVEVIGAGWGRTGTTSFKAAMEILGLPCYHMKEVFPNRDFKFWSRMADGEDLDLDEVFKRGKKVYRATCDFPSAPHWKKQLAKYPDAKVVLTTRDPESWYRSCVETVFRMNPHSPFMPIGIRVALWCGFPFAGFYEMSSKMNADIDAGDWSLEAGVRYFEEYNAAVIRDCPKDKLLVFRASEGWEPLCKFLGKPVPDVPYPHVNDAPEFQALIRPINAVGWVIMGAPAVLLVGAGLWWAGALSRKG